MMVATSSQVVPSLGVISKNTVPGSYNGMLHIWSKPIWYAFDIDIFSSVGHNGCQSSLYFRESWSLSGSPSANLCCRHYISPVWFPSFSSLQLVLSCQQFLSRLRPKMVVAAMHPAYSISGSEDSVLGTVKGVSGSDDA